MFDAPFQPLFTKSGWACPAISWPRTPASGHLIPNSADAYGSVRSGSTNPLPTDRTFTGQEQDTTGLMYYRARFFDPALGTFVSPDTVVPEPGAVADYNRFAYTRSNPLKFNDPSGHRPDDGCESEGCTLPNGLEPDATWLLANGAYANVDPQITAAEDYNPVTEALLPGAVMLVAGVAGGIVLEELFMAAGSLVSGWLGTAATATSTACANGDCTKYVRDSLPKLSGSFAQAFEGNPIVRTLKQGTVLYRSEAADATATGRWFGTQFTQSAERAERWWNVAKWANPRETLRAYELTQDVTVYYGKVAGGRGTQVFVPSGIPVDEVVRLIAETPLK